MEELRQLLAQMRAEMATKDDILGLATQLRTEMANCNHQLRTEMANGNHQLRRDMKTGFDSLGQEVQGLNSLTYGMWKENEFSRQTVIPGIDVLGQNCWEAVASAMGTNTRKPYSELRPASSPMPETLTGKTFEEGKNLLLWSVARQSQVGYIGGELPTADKVRLYAQDNLMVFAAMLSRPASLMVSPDLESKFYESDFHFGILGYKVQPDQACEHLVTETQPRLSEVSDLWGKETFSPPHSELHQGCTWRGDWVQGEWKDLGNHRRRDWTRLYDLNTQKREFWALPHLKRDPESPLLLHKAGSTGDVLVTEAANFINCTVVHNSTERVLSPGEPPMTPTSYEVVGWFVCPMWGFETSVAQPLPTPGYTFTSRDANNARQVKMLIADGRPSGVADFKLARFPAPGIV